KVWEHQSHGLQLMLRALQKDLEAAVTADCQQWALSLSETLQRAVKVTQQLGQALQSEPADEVLANASRYLRLFSYIMAAWMWLRQANVAARQLVQTTPDNQGYYRGKLQAARYFFHWELPTVAQDLVLLQNRDTTCLEMRPDWF
ncbi:acyl-CoA dehydrogenase C-terminal domain-containing protein, partial [uncultured Marinobacter sp.]|uniref:acyl-CoA dehydrogenase C-terminal domain-containing protein n=1 Tax=uncultured Marinobacter sp. TaxID=187379 RepID=UPI0030DA96E4